MVLRKKRESRGSETMVAVFEVVASVLLSSGSVHKIRNLRQIV